MTEQSIENNLHESLSPRTRKVLVALLIVIGIQVWLTMGRGYTGRPFQMNLLIAAAIVALLALVPAVSRRIRGLLDRAACPSRRLRLIIAGCIVPLASGYLVFTGWYQGRNFQPKWQDELSYIIQFRMMAQGKLWLPKHELADFFDSFQVIVDPVYASMYFPGAGLWYTPAQFFGIPFWLMSAVAGGISAALLYLIVVQLVDGVSGMLAVLMLLGLTMFRKLSLIIGGHPPMLMVELALIYSYLMWREQRRFGWILAIGIFAGWGAIIRPLDALVVALPVGGALLLDFAREPLGRTIHATALLFAGAFPFLALQLIVNIAVTGSWYRTPFDHYADRDYPGTRLGFHEFNPQRRPVSQLPQKQKYYDDFAVPAIQKHRPQLVIRNWLEGDLQRTLGYGMPHPMLIALLPAGVLGFVDRRKLVVWLAFPLFIVLFSFYTFSLPHYMIIVAPAIILWVLLGAQVIATTWRKLHVPLATFLTLSIAILSITETAEVNRLVMDEFFDPIGLRNVNAALAKLERRPAVVLFRWHERHMGDEEPVYNIETAWPDDAEIVRAHDLGSRNIEIFRYYGQRQPERMFYLYDRGDDTLTPLGTARDLAEKPTRE